MHMLNNWRLYPSLLVSLFPGPNLLEWFVAEVEQIAPTKSGRLTETTLFNREMFCTMYKRFFVCSVLVATLVSLNLLPRSFAAEVPKLIQNDASVILTYAFPLFNHALGAAKTFWIYAGICMAGFLFIKARLPETKGKTLQEIEDIWIQNES